MDFWIPGSKCDVRSDRTGKIFDLRYPDDFNTSKSPRWHSEINSETSMTMVSASESCDEFLLHYLMECIQFHQSLIK